MAYGETTVIRWDKQQEKTMSSIHSFLVSFLSIHPVFLLLLFSFAMHAITCTMCGSHHTCDHGHISQWLRIHYMVFMFVLCVFVPIHCLQKNRGWKERQEIELVGWDSCYEKLGVQTRTQEESRQHKRRSQTPAFVLSVSLLCLHA